MNISSPSVLLFHLSTTEIHMIDFLVYGYFGYLMVKGIIEMAQDAHSCGNRPDW